MFVMNAAGAARFSAEKMGKVTLAASGRMFAGLNCFEPGQAHAAHTHEGQDKMYLVLEGSGEVTVGGETRQLKAGDLAMAPAGVSHAVANTGEGRLVVMAILSPPPK